MQFNILGLCLLASTVLAKTVLLTNDDSWASTNIRATYYKLKEAGHNVILVAPVSQRSGFGGQFYVQQNKNLTSNGEFNYVLQGAPSWGHELTDDHIWYYNGTPASCVAFALTYVLPKYFATQNYSIDLVVSGPNEGTNMGGLYTLSGTMGATYNAVYRNLPAIAFSGSNSNNSFYKDSLNLSDPLDPSTIYAEQTVSLVNTIFENQGSNPRALPLGVGLNVNYPPVGYQNETCVEPKWVPTRITGDFASTADMVFNETAGVFEWSPHSYAALSVCNSGDCSLPTEDFIISRTACQASISVFQVDYDANLALTLQTHDLLKPLIG